MTMTNNSIICVCVCACVRFRINLWELDRERKMNERNVCNETKNDKWICCWSHDDGKMNQRKHTRKHTLFFNTNTTYIFNRHTVCMHVSEWVSEIIQLTEKIYDNKQVSMWKHITNATSSTVTATNIIYTSICKYLYIYRKSMTKWWWACVHHIVSLNRSKSSRF